MKESPDVAIADAYPEASILFADMAGFTARASNMTPQELVQFLNGVYAQIDSLVERHGLEKIKTTGDSYMVVSGVPEPRPDHAARIADLALDIRDATAGLVDAKGDAAPMRIGIASGPVVAGVIGTRKFFYDVWGDAVNTASRMKSTGEAGKIQVAPETRELLADGFVLEERGVIDVRGKGPMETWFLIERKPAKLCEIATWSLRLVIAHRRLHRRPLSDAYRPSIGPISKGQLSSGVSAVQGMSQKETVPDTGRESAVLATLSYQFSSPCIEAVSVITTSGWRKCRACRCSSSEAICACM